VEVGTGPVFVIAEAGINHNGELSRALDMIDAAWKAGANAIKFQTFRTDLLVSGAAPKAAYQAAGTGPGNQHSMLQSVELSFADHFQLKARCEALGIMFLSTPFEEESADFLEGLGIPAFKVPSGELTNRPYLEHLARKLKPLIVSTGMANLAEVKSAVRTIEDAGNSDIVLLHCVSQYPTKPRDANLRAMAVMRETFGCPVGFSDHTKGSAVAVAAAALGAAAIEKHFTLDRRLPGPDHGSSLEPAELTAMIADIHSAYAALGDGIKEPRPGEREIAMVARKSIVVITRIEAGERIEPHHIGALRPGTGIPPSCRDQVIGRRAARALSPDTVMQWSDLA
jgi:N-acetylneuraminate synthase/N,N'-diacetyllegionaminate synthase